MPLATVPRRLAAGLIALLLWSGCSADTPDHSGEIQAITDEMCLRSQVGRYDDIEALMKRLDQIEGAEANAAYGRATLAILTSVNELANVVAAGRAAVGGAFEKQAQDSSDITGILHRFLGDLDDVAKNLETVLTDTIAKYPNARVQVNGCVMYFGESPVMSMTGEWDVNEFRAWLGLVAMFRGAINAVLAQDLGVDVLGALEIVSRLSNSPVCQPNLMADKRCPMQILAWVLGRYDRFLAVAEPDGPQKYVRSREAFALAFKTMGDFVQGIADESDDQADDFFIVENVKRDADGRLLSATLVFQNIEYNEADFAWFNAAFFEGRRLVSLGGGNARRLEIKIGDDFMAAAESISEHMRNGGGPADTHEFWLPFVTILAPIMNVLFFDQINGIVDAYDPDGSMRAGIASSGFNLSDFALILFNSVIPPGFVLFDYYGFVDKPTPLRKFLPHYDYQALPDPEATLAIEWECGEYETVNAVCVTKVNDGAHFSGYPYQFEADGLAERFGYVAMQDPTFGGYFTLDVAAAPQTTATVKLPRRDSGPERVQGPVKPDNYLLNYGLHRVAAYVLTLIEEVQQ